MYSLADAEYFYNKKTKEVIPRKAYEKLLEDETKGVKSYQGILAIEKRLGFEFCYRDEDGTFSLPCADYKKRMVIEGLEEAKTAGGLTPTELRVAELVKQAKSNNEIAESLKIGEGTVRTHLRNVFKKLNITSRAALIIKEIN